MYNQISKPAAHVQTSGHDDKDDEKDFVEFRRKVRGAEVLSATMERLLRSVKFSGRICVVVQNGRVLKSGYEEGFFRHRSAMSEQLG